MSKNTRGPAFPLPVTDQECCGRFESGYGGMSLRDYFAAKAMQSLLATIDTYPDERWREGLAMDAYMMADAMLKEREK